MTRFFLDTEFDEDGKTIELISIGITTTFGNAYYAVSSEFDEAHCNDWVKANVLPLLPAKEARISRAQIRSEIVDFVERESRVDGKVEFWGYFSDYDWVALCQLFGKMVDLPKHWPMFCIDLKQRMWEFQIDKSDLPEQQGSAHNALEDAIWIRDAVAYIERYRMRLMKPRPGACRECLDATDHIEELHSALKRSAPIAWASAQDLEAAQNFEHEVLELMLGWKNRHP